MAIQSKGFFMDKQNDSVNELKKQLNALRTISRPESKSSVKNIHGRQVAIHEW